MIVNNRKILYVFFSITLAVFAVVACGFIERHADTALNSDITFSHESGFYDEPIKVELSVKGDYYLTYTLDGSEPSSESAKYESPILIDDASDNENNWSMITETSLYYINGYYTVPDYNVDKCTVLKVSAFDYSGNLANSDVREYFIGFNHKVGYEGMYNLCVVTDPKNLFSVDEGIYHVGTFLQGKIDSCKIYDMYRENNSWEGIDEYANWYLSGRELAEKPATIELYNPHGALLMREDCGVKIAGKGSRDEPQKSLRFIAREKYSGKDTFSYDIFDDGEGPKTFLIHSFGDDFFVKMVDYVVYAALRESEDGYKYTQTIPCNLFLEGEYWGPMFLEKPISTDVISENFGVSEDNIILIKTDEVKLGDEYEKLKGDELDRWHELLDFIKENDMSDQENYDYICSQMDIEDFANYAATQIYIGNSEWHLRNNFACWRTMKAEKGNPYSDGKWRFCVFDVNGSFSSDETIWEYMDPEWDTYHMVRDLCKNAEFKQLYLDNILDLEKLFDSELIMNIIKEWSNVMEEPIGCHFRRFTIGGDAKDMISLQREEISKYCANRSETIIETNKWLFE